MSDKREGAPDYKKWVLLAGKASACSALLLIALKAAVWLNSGSSSILASLTDSVLDLCASLVNLMALRFALTPPDKEHRFGHYKAEALASLAQAAFIGGSAFLLIFHGIERFLSPKELSLVNEGIAVSIGSVIITLALTSFQSYVCRKTGSLAISADRYHYLTDVCLNIGVIIALFLSKYGYLWADGLFAAMLGVYILKGSVHIALGASATLLDRSLSGREHEDIIAAVLKVPGVLSLHDLKTRRAGPQCYIQLHIVVDGGITLKAAHAICDAAERRVQELYPDADVSMHMEPNEEATYKDVEFYDVCCKR